MKMEIAIKHQIKVGTKGILDDWFKFIQLIFFAHYKVMKMCRSLTEPPDESTFYGKFDDLLYKAKYLLFRGLIPNEISNAKVSEIMFSSKNYKINLTGDFNELLKRIRMTPISSFDKFFNEIYTVYEARQHIPMIDPAFVTLFESFFKKKQITTGKKDEEVKVKEDDEQWEKYSNHNSGDYYAILDQLHHMNYIIRLNLAPSNTMMIDLYSVLYCMLCETNKNLIDEDMFDIVSLLYYGKSPMMASFKSKIDQLFGNQQHLPTSLAIIEFSELNFFNYNNISKPSAKCTNDLLSYLDNVVTVTDARWKFFTTLCGIRNVQSSLAASEIFMKPYQEAYDEFIEICKDTYDQYTISKLSSLAKESSDINNAIQTELTIFNKAYQDWCVLYATLVTTDKKTFNYDGLYKSDISNKVKDFCKKFVECIKMAFIFYNEKLLEIKSHFVQQCSKIYLQYILSACKAVIERLQEINKTYHIGIGLSLTMSVTKNKDDPFQSSIAFYWWVNKDIKRTLNGLIQSAEQNNIDEKLFKELLTKYVENDIQDPKKLLVFLDSGKNTFFLMQYIANMSHELAKKVNSFVPTTRLNGNKHWTHSEELDAELKKITIILKKDAIAASKITEIKRMATKIEDDKTKANTMLNIVKMMSIGLLQDKQSYYVIQPIPLEINFNNQAFSFIEKLKLFCRDYFDELKDNYANINSEDFDEMKALVIFCGLVVSQFGHFDNLPVYIQIIFGKLKITSKSEQRNLVQIAYNSRHTITDMEANFLEMFAKALIMNTNNDSEVALYCVLGNYLCNFCRPEQLIQLLYSTVGGKGANKFQIKDIGDFDSMITDVERLVTDRANAKQIIETCEIIDTRIANSVLILKKHEDKEFNPRLKSELDGLLEEYRNITNNKEK